MWDKFIARAGEELLGAMNRTGHQTLDDLCDVFRSPKSLAQMLVECGFSHIENISHQTLTARWKDKPLYVITQPDNHLELRAFLPITLNRAELLQPTVVSVCMGLLARNNQTPVSWTLFDKDDCGPFQLSCKLFILAANPNTISIAAETLLAELDRSKPLIMNQLT